MASLTSFLMLFVHVFMIFFNPCKAISPTTLPKIFPAILIFGDSTVDTGNNNYVNALFKANHHPYGKDFPGHIPTGRFSNGKLVPDFLASMFGIKESVPPFLDPNLSDHEIRTGVSFASAGSGYDNLTTVVTQAIPVLKQVEMFKNYTERLKGIVGEDEAKKIIGGALVVISAGTNDLCFSFYDIPTRKLKFNISGYQDFLLHRLQDFIKQLYDLGCRTMGVGGLPPIGCLPIQMTTAFESPIYRKCIKKQNKDSQRYNVKLGNLIPQIQAQLPGSNIFYSDIYKPLIKMIKHPKKFGFVETKCGCCGTGILEAGPLCTPITPTCGNFSEYLFSDSIHPTQPAYQYLSESLVKELLPKFLHNHTNGE